MRVRVKVTYFERALFLSSKAKTKTPKQRQKQSLTPTLFSALSSWLGLPGSVFSALSNQTKEPPEMRGIIPNAFVHLFENIDIAEDDKVPKP